ncbi:MAG: hypothetical protein JXB50_00030 [Spirochaetes bacterium]|nr:hypothetical protein [Spirochaetota bacterium]
MKRFIFLIVLIIILFSCQMPEDKEGKDDSLELKYDDGTPYIARTYGDTNIEYAIRLPYYSIMNKYTGRKITKAKAYFHKAPLYARIKVYQCNYLSTFPYAGPASEGDGGYPGFGTSALIANQLFTSGVTYMDNSWHIFSFTSPITVPANKDIWVIVEITTSSVSDMAFCFDRGPGNLNSNYYRLTVNSGSWNNSITTFDTNVMIRAFVE